MDRVYQANVSQTPIAAPTPGSYGFVQGEPPLSSLEATEPGPFFFQYVTESFRYVIVQAGMTPDATSVTQLRDAVLRLASA